METKFLTEAARLMSLDKEGREQEVIATILHLNLQSEESMATLRRLNREALDGLREEWSE